MPLWHTDFGLDSEMITNFRNYQDDDDEYDDDDDEYDNDDEFDDDYYY